MGRLKTGTPPRLDGATIDWASLEIQHGDDPPEPFSVADRRRSRRRRSPATSPAPPPRRTASSGRTSHRSRGLFRRDLRARARAIARRSRTRSCGSPSATATRSSSSPRGSTTRPSIRTAFRPRCRRRSQRALVAHHPGTRARRASSAPAMRSNTTTSTRASSTRRSRRSGFGGLFLAGPDQRHDRL